MTNSRVLSGVQPTGNLHLGNYLGAIRNWVGLQDSHECLFMLADLHAITVPQNPADLTRNTRETAAAYIACGIDPKKSVIFPQSAVSVHSELAWILNCHTPLGWLNRMTQFKDKSGENRDAANLGLYAYRADFLEKFVRLAPGKLEQIEKLEQLRVLENGYPIAIDVSDDPTIGVDTPEDAKKFEALLG